MASEFSVGRKRRRLAAPWAIGAPDGRCGLVEQLEPRLVLATFTVADYFPLQGGEVWSYSGTVTDNMVQHDVAAVMTSTANQVQSGVSFTEMNLTLAGTGYAAAIVRYYVHSGGLKMGRDQLTRNGLTQTNNFGTGVMLTTPTMESEFPDLVTIFPVAYSRSYTGTDNEGGSWTSNTPHAIGNVFGNGTEQVVTPAGTFDAIRLKREGTIKDSGQNGDTLAFIRNGTIVEEFWLVDGIGIVKMDVHMTETGRPEGDVDFQYTLELTNTTVGDGQIEVRGRDDLLISNNDTTPNFADGTGFATVDINGQTRTRTFTIRNTGSGTLNLVAGPKGGPSIDMSGLAPDQYAITLPGSSSIAPGGELTFQVTFDPVSIGNKRARVNVYTDSTTDSTFSFTVRGTGAAGGLVELRSGPDNAEVENGSFATARDNGTRFGIVNVDGGTFSRIYKLTNLGEGDLSITNLTIGGRNAGQFSITQFPTTPVAPGQTVRFRITFNPTSVGFKRATISFTTSDWRFPGGFSYDITGTAV